MDRFCPETGEKLERGFRKITLIYKGLSTIINMPGWYSKNLVNGIHSKRDLQVYDHILNGLKKQIFK